MMYHLPLPTMTSNVAQKLAIQLRRNARRSPNPGFGAQGEMGALQGVEIHHSWQGPGRATRRIQTPAAHAHTMEDLSR